MPRGTTEPPLWLVFEPRGSRDVHVMPNFGREHAFDEACWCCPEVEQHDRRLIVHRENN